MEFSPDANFDSIGGFVEFTYRVSDFQYTSASPGTVKIKILPRNDAPTFSTYTPSGDVNVSENTENIIIVWANPELINDGDAEAVQELNFIIESISNEDLFERDGLVPFSIVAPIMM